MLKARPAGDKSWPIKCGGVTLGGYDKELDMGGYNMSYGIFEDAEFIGLGKVNFAGANFKHADLSGSNITAGDTFDNTLIDFTGANLANADLSDSDITADSIESNYFYEAIDFTGANLANTDLGGSKITADRILGLEPTSPPAPPQSPPSP
eukprot:scaffold80119_cov64-Phaeocystis_antarctica.AAC.1